MARSKRADQDDDGAQASSGRSSRRRRGRGMREVITAAAFMPLASRAPLYARLLWSLVTDSRTPATRKAMLGAALGYIALGRDVVPDSVPILGQLDDVVVVALAIEVFLDGLDEDLLAEKLEEAGIPRVAYDEDVARVRRLLPGPLRRAAQRIPGAIRMVADTVGRSGIDRGLRGWIGGGSTAKPT